MPENTVASAKWIVLCGKTLNACMCVITSLGRILVITALQEWGVCACLCGVGGYSGECDESMLVAFWGVGGSQL